MTRRNRYLDAADALKPSKQRGAMALTRYLAGVEAKAAHIERIGYRPKRERWTQEACEVREWGILRQLETTASQSVPIVYDRTSKSLVSV